MRTHVAFLRAVNVSGTGKVAMAELKVLAGDLGFEEAATVLHSGNLVFRTRGEVAALRDRLADSLKDRFGLKTVVVIRTADQWRAVINGNPYPEAAKDIPGHLVAMPLSDTPKAGAIDDLRAAIQGNETVELKGADLYAVYPEGMGKSKLLLGVIEKKLGVKTTARNWNTTLKIAALFEAD